MNVAVFNMLMYALTKEAASTSFADFLERWQIADEQYEEIRKYLFEKYGVVTYV